MRKDMTEQKIKTISPEMQIKGASPVGGCSIGLSFKVNDNMWHKSTYQFDNNSEPRGGG